LTEQNVTGGSVLLFVASSTASQSNLTKAYYFKLFHNKQMNSINFLQKEQPNNLKDVLCWAD